MTCPNDQQWVLLSMDVLAPAEAAALHSHRSTCPACQARFEHAQTEHRAILDAHDAFGRGHEAMREQLMAELSTDTPIEAFVPRSNRFIDWGDRIMSVKHRKAARAALVLVPAACLAIVALMFLSLGEHRALADAVARLHDASTISCRVHMTMTAKMTAAAGVTPAGIDPAKLEELGDQTYERTEQLWMSAQQGARRDTYEDGALITSVFVAPGAEQSLIVNHADRTYQAFAAKEASRIPDRYRQAMTDLMSDRPIAGLQFMSASNEPQRLLDRLRDLTGDPDRALGERIIDGRKAVGYELAGERVGFGPPLYEPANTAQAQVWVDVENGDLLQVVVHTTHHLAAVRELPLTATFSVSSVYDQFQLDPPLPADWFEPTIPDGFTEADAGLAELGDHLSEQGLLDGLRVFGEVAGRYPKNLHVMDLMYEVSYLMGSMQAKRLVAERKGESTKGLPDNQEVGRQLQGLGYYMILQSTDRAPEYFGDEVQPGDAEGVLLRWKTEDGRMRIVHGDLTIESAP